MEEKKTGKLGRLTGSLLSILLLFALAVGFVSLYPRMTQEAGKVYEDVLEWHRQALAERYVSKLCSFTYGMYVDWYQEYYKTEKTPGEILLGASRTELLENEDYMYWYSQHSQTTDDWYASVYLNGLEEYQLSYFIKMQGELMGGVGNVIPEKVFEDEEKYPVFIQLAFDEAGNPTIVQSRGIEYAQQLAGAECDAWMPQSELCFENGDENYVIVGEHVLKNMEVLLVSGSPMLESQMLESMKESVYISNPSVWDARRAMAADYAIFVMVALGVVVLLGLLLPSIRPLGLKEGWKAHIPLELLVLAGGMTAGLLAEYIPEFVVKCQIEMEHPGVMFYWIGIMEDVVADGREVYVLKGANVILWFAIFLVTYLCAINVRQLFAKGILRFIKENTLTGRILVSACGGVKKLVMFCGEINFSNKGNRNFLIAVGLNFVVVALFCCTWVFGIVLAVPYSVGLLWLLQKKWNKIRHDYDMLLFTTEEMASGITDVEYVAETGIFHELREALQGVQTGFHTAVQEEVKSQKMKTELITNVSHDLKTPLTAIITYVDLLKNETITEEERREYISVLEQKSSRLKSLIEDLFEISKATSGNIQLERVALDLVQLIQEVQLELESEIMKSGIGFKVNLPEEKVLVNLDAQKTCRIFENLTVNILKHGLSGSRAYITMEQTEKTVSIIYKNISSAEINYDAEEIMERFTRGDASRNTEGSGLGLAIVKSFAEAQGGKVKVELDGDLFKVVVSFPKVTEENAK